MRRISKRSSKKKTTETKTARAVAERNEIDRKIELVSQSIRDLQSALRLVWREKGDIETRIFEDEKNEIRGEELQALADREDKLLSDEARLNAAVRTIGDYIRSLKGLRKTISASATAQLNLFDNH